MGRSSQTEESKWRKRAIALENRLSDQERRYAIARAAGLPKGESAIAAGYSKKSAPSIASRCESRGRVQEYISLLRRGVVTKTALSTKNIDALIRRNEENDEFEQSLDRLRMKVLQPDIDLISADPSDIFTVENGRVICKDFKDLTPSQRKRISGFKYQFEPGENGKSFLIVELYSRDKALDRLHSYLGLKGKGAILGELISPPKKPEQEADAPVKGVERGISKAAADMVKASILGVDALPSDEEAKDLLGDQDEPKDDA